MKSWKWEIFICWTGQGFLRSSTRHASVSSNKMLMRSAPTPRDGVPLLRPATPPSSGAVSRAMSREPYHQGSHVINPLEVGGIWESGDVVKVVIDHISSAVIVGSLARRLRTITRTFLDWGRTPSQFSIREYCTLNLKICLRTPKFRQNWEFYPLDVILMYFVKFNV